jgi:hypothetical protein
MAKQYNNKNQNQKQQVRVSGYTRDDGTRVAPYTRSMPNR